MNVSPQEVAESILKFLKEEYSSEVLTEEDRESLEVAIDCIKKVYRISGDDFSKSADIPNLVARSKSQFDPSKAEHYRNQGNLLMSEKKYTEALSSYDKAVECDPSNHLHYANRAAAFLKLDRFQNAVEDAQNTINLAPNFHKGYGRLGLALMGLSDFHSAKAAFEEALKLDTDNPVYKEKIAVCENKITSNPQAAGLDGLGAILNNPAVVNMARGFLQNPQFQQMFSNVAENIQNGSGGLDGLNLAGMMENLQNDPAFMNIMQQFGQNPPPEPEQ